MSELFLTVLNMSLTASYVILFVIIVRLLLKKAPKFISYVLWGVVAFRLIIPFSFESMFSLMPRNTNAVSIPHDIIYQQNPQINSGIEVVDSFINNSLPAPTIGASVNPLQIYVEIGAYIWVFGIIALLVYSLVSVLLLKIQLKGAQLIEKNIFEAENLKTPFVLGLINPVIYLPVGLSKEEQNYILIHEQTHIHRKDHIIKTLAFLIVSIHWFNPLVWIAFILMSTDMELSCDERVLKVMNEDIKKPYANSLLSLATGRHILNGSPLAFGEGNVKGRIKNVLNYKKPRFWVVVFTIIIVTAIGIGLIANPAEGKRDLSALKYLAKISYQRDELLVSIAPGKSEGFNVSARAIAEYLDSVNWIGMKMDTPPKLSVALKIEWSEDQELILYESEPPLAMVRMGKQQRCYKIDQNDYETLISIVETASGPRSDATEKESEPLTKEPLTAKDEYAIAELTKGDLVKLPDFEYDGSDPIEKLVYATEIEKYSRPQQGFTIVAPKIFGSYEEDGLLKVFVTTFSATYKLYGNVLDQVGGSVVPAAITYKKDNSGNYVLEKYEQAKDGADWQSSIEEFCTMPASGKEIPGLADKIIEHYTNYDDIRILHWRNLFKHLRKNGIKEATLYNSSGEIEVTMSDPQYIN